MDDKTETVIVIVSGSIAILVLVAFIGLAYVHDTKTITVSDKELSNGFAYVFTVGDEYYTVPNLGVYGSLKVGHTYAVSTAIHVMGSPRNIDSAVEV